MVVLFLRLIAPHSSYLSSPPSFPPLSAPSDEVDDGYGDSYPMLPGDNVVVDTMKKSEVLDFEKASRAAIDRQHHLEMQQEMQMRGSLQQPHTGPSSARGTTARRAMRGHRLSMSIGQNAGAGASSPGAGRAPGGLVVSNNIG